MLHSQLQERMRARITSLQQRLVSASPEEQPELQWLLDNVPRLPETPWDIVCLDSACLDTGFTTGVAGFSPLIQALLQACAASKREKVPSCYLRLQSLVAKAARSQPIMRWHEFTEYVRKHSTDEMLLTTRGLLGRATAFLHMTGRMRICW